MMTILKYEYMDVIKPHPFFPTIIERELARRGLGESRRVLFYMPGNFSSMPRILDEIQIDAFLGQRHCTPPPQSLARRTDDGLAALDAEIHFSLPL